jgi:hypothetical protein
LAPQLDLGDDQVIWVIQLVHYRSSGIEPGERKHAWVRFVCATPHRSSFVVGRHATEGITGLWLVAHHAC